MLSKKAVSQSVKIRRCGISGILVILALLLFPAQSFAFASAEFAIEEICGHIQGNLGGLLLTTAGIGALVAAALGNFRASYSMIIVAIGGASTSAMMSLYFADASQTCANGDPQQVQTSFERQATSLQAPVDFNVGASTGRDLISQNEAAIAIASGRLVDFSRGAQFNHGESDAPTEAAEYNPALADLADTF